MEYLLTVFGNLTLQGGHIPWIATHRLHHQLTDQDGDPHSPIHGFWHAHLLWMLKEDHSRNNDQFLLRLAPDLYKDKFHYWLNKFWWAPTIVLAITIYLLAGFPAVGWLIIVRVTLGLHLTWAVDSVCHRWGKQPFENADESRNNWLVAILTFGEGWHNNHHNKPTRARHGLKWNQFDLSWEFIRILQLFRLARDIKL